MRPPLPLLHVPRRHKPAHITAYHCAPTACPVPPCTPLPPAQPRNPSPTTAHPPTQHTHTHTPPHQLLTDESTVLQFDILSVLQRNRSLAVRHHRSPQGLNCAENEENEMRSARGGNEVCN